MIQDLSKNAKPLSLKTLFVSVLIYGHESWIMTARVRLQMQESKMRFLRRIKEVALLNKVFQKSLNIEPLLLRIEKCQLRLVGHVSKIPQKRLPKQVLLAKANEGTRCKTIKLPKSSFRENQKTKFRTSSPNFRTMIVGKSVFSSAKIIRECKFAILVNHKKTSLSKL